MLFLSLERRSLMNERLKELRKTQGLTMEKFGEKLGVGKTAISKLENGERNLTDQMIKSICREFNVSEEWLRNGTGEMFAQRDKLQVISEFAADLIKEPDSVKARLFEALAKLDDKDWLAIEIILDKITIQKEKG